MRKEEDEDQRVRNLFREITKLLPERSKIKTDLLYFKYAPILVMLFRWYSVSQFYDSKMEITLWYEENSTFKSSAMTSQIVGQAVAPINQVLAGLQNEVAGIKCKLPETITTPYSPFTAVPNCVAYQAGLYGLNAANNGFWG